MFSNLLRRPEASRTDRRTKRNLAVESLEGRKLMSLGVEFGIPTTTQGAQLSSDNASSSNGTSVVVWTDYSHGDGDIRAQRLNAQGNKWGPELIVAGKVGINEYDPAVAMDAQGDFVVTWTQDHASGGTDVLAQKFSAGGVPVNGTVPVGVGTFAESQADVAMDAQGNFVVAYTRNTDNTNPDVFAKRYNTSSQLLGVITVGGAATHPESLPSIAMSPDGRFDVAYQYGFTSTDQDVIVDRYAATGTLLQVAEVADTGLPEQVPSIAIDNHGNAVVAFQEELGGHWSIEARRLSATGTLGNLVTVSNSTTNQFAPTVALEGNAGAFVVAYNIGTEVDVTRVNSSNGVLDTQSVGQQRYGAALSINAQNEYLVTYTGYTPTDSNIYGRRGLL